MVLMLSLHPSRASTIRHPECLEVQPHVTVSEFIDTFGNRCSRVFVPAGRVMLHNEAIVEDTGQPDPQVWDAHSTTCKIWRTTSCGSCLPAATAPCVGA